MQIFDKASDAAIDRCARYYAVLFGGSVILGVLAKTLYRSNIYAHHIDDFHVADSAPNFFFVTGSIWLRLYVYRKKKLPITRWNAIWPGTLGAIIYELTQLKDGGTFDYHDILASLLGAVIAYCIDQYLARATLKNSVV